MTQVFNENDKRLFYELVVEVKNIKEMEARHSRDSKLQFAGLANKLESFTQQIHKERGEDKKELLEKIESNTKLVNQYKIESIGMMIKIGLTGVISGALGNYGTKIFEQYFSKIF